MIVTCVDNYCKERHLLLPINADAKIMDDNFIVLMGYTVDSQTTEYMLTKERDYTVHGIMAYDGQVRFLLQDDDGFPVFCPDNLFVTKDSHIYWDWCTSTYEVEGKPLLIVGYPEITTPKDYSNLIDLIKRNKNGIDRFLQYKAHYEEYMNVIG